MRLFSPLSPKKADWPQSMGLSHNQRLVNFETMTAVLIFAVGDIDLMQFLMCFSQHIMTQNTNIELQCKRKRVAGENINICQIQIFAARECEKK